MYRTTTAPVELGCPRCSERLPPVDAARCTCGIWLTPLAAAALLTDAERRADPVTRWWKIRPPCPMCGEQMSLHGDGDGHFVGCDGHGYWIDADAIPHTSVRDGIDQAAIARYAADEAQRAKAQQEREQAEERRRVEREEKDRREAALQDRLESSAADAAERRLDPDLDPMWAGEELDRKAMFRYLVQRIRALEARVQTLEARP